jgi:hypothetical protein
VKRLTKAPQDTIRLRHARDGLRPGKIPLQPERVPADTEAEPNVKGATLQPSTTPSQPKPPAGWYDDAAGAGLRWWDGAEWTEHVQARPERQQPHVVPLSYSASPDTSSKRGRAAVIGAAVILAAALVTAFILLSGGSASENQREADLIAAEYAHSAQIAVETYATENEGYAGVSVSVLQEIEPTLPDDLEVSATGEYSYMLTVPSGGENSFTISNKHGVLRFTCEQPGEGSCPVSGNWAS